MTKRLTVALRGAPATVPGLAAVALFLLWATDQAGYPLTHWAPGGLIVLALVAIALATVPPVLSQMPTPVRIAIGCLALYTLLSLLSILWASVPGDAWEGADRTLLYLLVFVLFATWPQRGTSALLLLATWTLGIIVLALFVVLHLRGANLDRLIPGGRLVYPTGYVNANAALWLMAFWPALLLARSARLPWGLRGALAGGAVLLAEVALLSQSRGSLYATAAMVVLVFLLVPGRLRSFALLVPVAGAITLATPTILRAGERIESRSSGAHAAFDHASLTIFATALAVGLGIAIFGTIAGRRTPSAATAAKARRGLGATALLTLAVIVIGGLLLAGNPVTRVRDGWDTFKGGYAANSTTGNRLISGLGSNRYDFYRVALDEFVHHPVAGIGADNFAVQYLRHGRSEETPRYPHSVELRTLSQTGLLGALLAIVGLGAALVGATRAMRAPDPLVRAVAAAALAGFAYWLLHGSVDWFWEFAGLGAPAFAMLGLACALAPRVPQTRDAQANYAQPVRRSRGRRRLTGLAAALIAAAVAASLAAPWLSRLQVQRAARIWARDPTQAYAILGHAAQLNPLSDEPYLVAGSIALRFDDPARADHEFALALTRVSVDSYATLERGAIASQRGDRSAALVLLARAASLNPRDPLAREALELVVRGGRVTVNKLNATILSNAQQLS